MRAADARDIRDHNGQVAAVEHGDAIGVIRVAPHDDPTNTAWVDVHADYHATAALAGRVASRLGKLPLRIISAKGYGTPRLDLQVLCAAHTITHTHLDVGLVTVGNWLAADATTTGRPSNQPPLYETVPADRLPALFTACYQGRYRGRRDYLQQHLHENGWTEGLAGLGIDPDAWTWAGSNTSCSPRRCTPSAPPPHPAASPCSPATPPPALRPATPTAATVGRGEITTRFVTRGRVPYRVDLDPDPHTTPGEFDCYSFDDKAAFRQGRWQYVVVTVAVDLPHVDVQAVLGGAEYGDLRNIFIGMPQLLDQHPVPDLIAECRQQLAELHTNLNHRLTNPALSAAMQGGNRP